MTWPPDGACGQAGEVRPGQPPWPQRVPVSTPSVTGPVRSVFGKSANLLCLFLAPISSCEALFFPGEPSSHTQADLTPVSGRAQSLTPLCGRMCLARSVRGVEEGVGEQEEDNSSRT